MTTVLSEFDARPINSELLQVLNELMNIFRFAQQSRGQTEPDQTKTSIEYDGLLSKCDSFSDVFEVVKSSVRESINQERAGMVLQLAELPLRIGAAHNLGGTGGTCTFTILEKR